MHKEISHVSLITRSFQFAYRHSIVRMTYLDHSRLVIFSNVWSTWLISDRYRGPFISVKSGMLHLRHSEGAPLISLGRRLRNARHCRVAPFAMWNKSDNLQWETTPAAQKRSREGRPAGDLFARQRRETVSARDLRTKRDEDKVKGNARDVEARIELIAQSNNVPMGTKHRQRLHDVVFFRNRRCRRYLIRAARRVRFYWVFDFISVPLIN